MSTSESRDTNTDASSARSESRRPSSTKTALSAQSKAVYRAYVIDERPIGEVAAEFNIPRNSVSQIKTRVERLVSAIENEF